jgi:ubiquinone/menaquinone biosynthesis C-methylase UbiE
MEERRQLFDDWPQRYDAWFETPIGRLVKRYEAEVILELLEPRPGERILDAGCGTGLFTADFLDHGAYVVGLDLSLSMLRRGIQRGKGRPFLGLAADMRFLPFVDESFDKAVSVTTIEFIEDARGAVEELFRVTRPGGIVVVATLNSLSPWAQRRRMEARKKKDSVFRKAVFRSPEDLRGLIPGHCELRTAVHFLKDDDPEEAVRIEAEGRRKGLETGAFVAARWIRT